MKGTLIIIKSGRRWPGSRSGGPVPAATARGVSESGDSDGGPGRDMNRPGAGPGRAKAGLDSE